jgi:hypothetical protein
VRDYLKLHSRTGHEFTVSNQPDQGLVRYLDADDKSKSELKVPVDTGALVTAKSKVAQTAGRIK